MKRRKKSPVRPRASRRSRSRAAWLLTFALAVASGAAWLATTALADGSDVLTYQLSLGTPHPEPEREDGVLGTAPGEFVFPFGVAVDSSGRFLVTDTEEGNAVDHDNDGIMDDAEDVNENGVLDPGEDLNNNGTLDPADEPGTDWDEDGNAGEQGNRVQIFAPDGTVETVLGGTGSGPGQFRYPTSITVDACDNIIVSDNDNNRIQIFSPAHARDANGVVTGGVVPQFRAQYPNANTPEAQRLTWPSGVAIKPGTCLLPQPGQTDADGRLAIVDLENDRVIVLNSQLEWVHEFGAPADNDNPPGTFDTPWAVAIDSQGRFFVSDNANHRVQAFDQLGGILWLFGADESPSGAPGPGDLSHPTGVSIDPAGRLLVADTDRHRVLRVDITTDIGSESPLPRCADPAEHLARCQVETNTGQHFAALVLGGAESGVAHFMFPQGVATDPTGRVAIVDTDQQMVRVFQPARIEIVSATATAPPDGARVGEPISLVITVVNSGGSAVGVEPNVTPSLTGTLTGDFSSQQLEPGEEATFNVTFVPSQQGSLTFTVGAEGSHSSGATVPAADVTTSPAIDVAGAREPSLRTAIAVDRTFVGIGDTITVSVTLENSGNTTFDTISADVSFDNPIVEFLSGPRDVDGNDAPFGVDLVPGESRTRLYRYEAKSEGSVFFSVTSAATYRDSEGVSHDYVPTESQPPLSATIEEPVTITKDAVAPVTTWSVDKAPDGNNGWYLTNFELTLTATDNSGGTGVQSITYRVFSQLSTISETVQGDSVTILMKSEGTSSVHFFATDANGNEEPLQRLDNFFRLDKTAPVITDVVISPTANASGWHKDDVTLQVVADDSWSGVGPVPPVIVTTEGADQEIPLIVFDVAGNSATTERVVSIDKTAPTLTCSTKSGGYVWPPNHKWVPWETEITEFSDATSGVVGTFRLASATSNENPNGNGDGTTSNDIRNFVINTPDTLGEIRAERSGTAGGRIYSLLYEGTDVAGNIGSCVVITSEVPHSTSGVKKIK